MTILSKMILNMRKSLLVKYKPINNLPKTNNKVVIKAPTHTSLHLIRASGNNLNIIANIKVIIIEDMEKLNICIKYLATPDQYS